jgi:hypothetical protein
MLEHNLVAAHRFKPKNATLSSERFEDQFMRSKKD